MVKNTQTSVFLFLPHMWRDRDRDGDSEIISDFISHPDERNTRPDAVYSHPMCFVIVNQDHPSHAHLSILLVPDSKNLKYLISQDGL